MVCIEPMTKCQLKRQQATIRPLDYLIDNSSINKYIVYYTDINFMQLKLLFCIYFIYIMINILEINIPIFNKFGYELILFEHIIFNSCT